MSATFSLETSLALGTVSTVLVVKANGGGGGGGDG